MRQIFSSSKGGWDLYTSTLLYTNMQINTEDSGLLGRGTVSWGGGGGWDGTPQKCPTTKVLGRKKGAPGKRKGTEKLFEK